MLLPIQISKEIESLIEEEKKLVFPAFSKETAWKLGSSLLEEARLAKVSLTLDIRTKSQIMFHYSMEGTCENNERWVEMKSNCVLLMDASSYRCGLENKRDNTSLEERHKLPSGIYADHGGSYPLRVQGMGLVGTITVSGLPQKEDHNFVRKVIQNFINKNY